MRILRDVFHRDVRLSDERLKHVMDSHPEMKGQLLHLKRTLLQPETIVESRIDNQVELFYRRVRKSPFGEKFFCAVIKKTAVDQFILTFYFTDAIKKGKTLWKPNDA
jgi:hypothetical protein